MLPGGPHQTDTLLLLEYPLTLTPRPSPKRGSSFRHGASVISP